MLRSIKMCSLAILLLLLGSSYGEQYKVTDQVFFDITFGDEELGRIVIGLFGEITPKTVKNFKTIATDGIDGKTYVGSKFHRIIKDFMIQGGDIANRDGTGSVSIYGQFFPDENFEVAHSTAGFISMANSGPDTNGCQFFIITRTTSWLDGRHTVFGKVVEGQDIVHRIENIKTDPEARPAYPVVITKSGSVPTPTPFFVSDEAYNFFDLIRAGAVPLSFSTAILLFFQYVIQRLRKHENIKVHLM